MTIYSHSTKGGIPAITAKFAGMRKEKNFVLFYGVWNEDFPLMLQSDNRIVTVYPHGNYRVTPAGRKSFLVATYLAAEKQGSLKRGTLTDDDMQHLIEIHEYMMRRNLC